MFPRKTLRQKYVDSLVRYEGTKYVWDGENRLGIDCSGLVRKGLIDAAVRAGISTWNPRLIRRQKENLPATRSPAFGQTPPNRVCTTHTKEKAALQESHGCCLENWSEADRRFSSSRRLSPLHSRLSTFLFFGLTLSENTAAAGHVTAHGKCNREPHEPHEKKSALQRVLHDQISEPLIYAHHR